VGECDAAQAVELVRALHDQVRQMTIRLSRVEHQGGAATGDSASGMRLEAAALRRDIYEAHKLIDRLQRRYHLDGGDEQTQPANGQRPNSAPR
jgi:hypothetical protein